MVTTAYFSHDANASNDPKVVKLIEELGPEGYGIFWLLVETLRQQEPTYCYPISLLPALSRRFNTTNEKMKAVVAGYSLFQVSDDGKIFFSQSLIDRMAIMEAKREKYINAGRIGGSKKALNVASLQHRSSIALASPSNKSKLKEIKVKEIKLKEKKEDTLARDPYFYLADNVNSNQDLVKKWVHWVEFRKKMKKPYRTKEGEAAAYNRLLKLAESNSDVAIEIIDQSIANEWQGLFALKTENNGKPKTMLQKIYEKNHPELDEEKWRKEAERWRIVTNQRNNQNNENSY